MGLENIHCMISAPLHLLRFVLWPNVVFPRECSMCLWEECHPAAVWKRVLCGCLLGLQSVHSVAEVFYFLIDLLSSCSIHYQTWDWTYCSLWLLLVNCQFLPSFLLILHVFWGSVIRFTYIYNSYVFLMGWPFYYYKMSLFISGSNFCLKSALSAISRAPPAFFGSSCFYT